MTTRLFLWWKKLISPSRPFDISAIRSIVCIETSRMGDVVSALPLLYSFHKANPQATITVITDIRYVDIVRNISFVSVVLGLENTATGMGFFGARRVVKRIKADLAVSASPSYRNALLTLSTAAKYKIGYFTSQSPSTPFLFKSKVRSIGFQLRQDETYWMENMYERSLKIAKALHIPVHNGWKLDLDESAGDEAMRRVGVRDLKFVVMHPFSGWNYRSWDLRNYLQLAEQLNRRNIHTILTGDEHDLKKIDKKIFAERNYLHQMLGEQLPGVMRIMKRSLLFVGNDSGPLHLATALGVKCVGLYGPASPDLTAPISDINIYLYEQVECSPCEQIRCIHADNPCIRLLSVERVTESVLKLLGNDITGVH